MQTQTQIQQPAAESVDLDASPAPEQDVAMQASLIADTTVPDGGYGWVVVLACAVHTWWFVGASYTWGVMQAALVKKGCAASTLAFVGSLCPACIAIFAIPNASAIRLIGARLTALLGISLLGLGSILSGFTVDSIPGLFITWGLAAGIGTSLCFMVVSVIPAQYFKEKRGIANGIVYAGGGLGGTVMSFILNTLIECVGIAWTFRIFGFMILGTGLPATYLIKERIPIRATKFVEWHLFRDVRFILVFLIGLIGTFPLFVPAFFLPLYTNSLGLPSSAGAGLVAAFNFCSTIGRLSCGYACDKLGTLSTLFLTQLLSALSLFIIWPLSSSIGPLVAFVAVNGIANGGFFSTMPTVVGNVFGSARVSIAMGMIVSGWIGGYLLGAPIAGYMLSAYGGESSGIAAYRPAIFYAASMAMAATILAAYVRLNVDRSLKKTV
ncbi:major facilitator superfamily domain-containing protein [Achaetomium macrosporum]|uniref:Major facilitator superfamily domain-containing protein n=1 Tax=Achaetomium macrosporum TaxID=79813 RepID=A0AAN7C725_9PEZI|nr:major facilitator superfamily domain-containing protein [Achaetomium macrosporum]